MLHLSKESKLIKPGPPENLLFEKDFQGQLVQVWEKLDRRELRFGNQVVQSAMSTLQPDCLLLRYTKQMLASLALVPQLTKILHIGLGGGSLPSFLHYHFPDLNQCVVEINPLVIEIAFEFFQLPQDPRLRVHQLDLSKSWGDLTEGYDLILLDAYDQAGTSSIFDSSSLLYQLQERLHPGGWLIGNFWNHFRLYPAQRNLWQGLCGQLLEAQTGLLANAILYGHIEANRLTLQEAQLRARSLERKLPLRLLPLVQRLHYLN